MKKKKEKNLAEEKSGRWDCKYNVPEEGKALDSFQVQFPGLGNMVDELIEKQALRDNALKHDDNPWKHRSTGMRCRTCMYFVEKARSDTNPENKENTLGRCRRNAPTMSGWPAVFVTDWCGQMKLDENKI